GAGPRPRGAVARAPEVGADELADPHVVLDDQHLSLHAPYEHLTVALRGAATLQRMRFRTSLLATGAACALLGGGAGALLNASAAPTKTAKAAKAAKGPLKRAVHVEAVVARS